MKRIYIVHGFCLALLGYTRGALDPRFDTVEAWKNGPVIPSVYHSFKYNRDNPITEKAVIVECNEKKMQVLTPGLVDEEVKEISAAVWAKYKDKNDFQMIKMLHRPGTPWHFCYESGKNNPIPDLYTMAFYKKSLRS